MHPKELGEWPVEELRALKCGIPLGDDALELWLHNFEKDIKWDAAMGAVACVMCDLPLKDLRTTAVNDHLQTRRHQERVQVHKSRNLFGVAMQKMKEMTEGFVLIQQQAKI